MVLFFISSIFSSEPLCLFICFKNIQPYFWIILIRATLKCLFDNFNISVISGLTSIGIFLPCKVLRFPAPSYDQKLWTIFMHFAYSEMKILSPIENIDLCVLAGRYGQQSGSYIPEGCSSKVSWFSEPLLFDLDLFRVHHSVASLKPGWWSVLNVLGLLCRLSMHRIGLSSEFHTQLYGITFLRSPWSFPAPGDPSSKPTDNKTRASSSCVVMNFLWLCVLSVSGDKRDAVRRRRKKVNGDSHDLPWNFRSLPVATAFMLMWDCWGPG